MIRDIKNTFLRRLATILFAPFAVVMMAVIIALEVARYAGRGAAHAWRNEAPEMLDLLDAIGGCWKGRE